MEHDVSDDEIEVTPEMIRAGVDAYAANYLSLALGDLEVDQRMVCDVFRAMLRSRHPRI